MFFLDVVIGEEEILGGTGDPFVSILVGTTLNRSCFANLR